MSTRCPVRGEKSIGKARIRKSREACRGEREKVLEM